MDLIIQDRDEVLVAFEKYRSTIVEKPVIGIIQNQINNDNYNHKEEDDDDDFFNDDNYHNDYNSQLDIANIIICDEALSLIGIIFISLFL